MSKVFNRRSMMRGMLGGAAVCVGVPTLDIFLDGNGKAYAQGAKLPVRLGTYFWGLGLTPGRWVPKTIGHGYELTPQLQALKGLESKVSTFSNFRVELDGRSNLVHWTGQGAIMSGVAPTKANGFDRATFDVYAAEQIGGGTRFRSLQMTPFGISKLSYSTPSGTGFNTPETTPLQLYTRVFGDGFQDPNNPNWSPDVNIMLRKSVLSAVGEQRQALMAQASVDDRRKLDQYFTALRQTEEQLASQLERPAKCESCVVPSAPEETRRAGQIDVVNQNSKLMAQITAMAVACNQTNIFNVVHTSAASEAYLPGDTSIYHSHTHDEPVDPKLGYQIVSDRLATQSFSGYADFLHALNAIKEGDGTLLDNCVVLGYSDTGNAKIHSTENIPMFIAGGAGGRHKPAHVSGSNDPVSRVSLTVQQLLGLPVGEYGVGSMKTGKAITEVMA